MPDRPTSILPFNPDSIAQAAALIVRGDLVAVPTETVYGLAGDATNGAAVAAIYEAKGRPGFNPLIVHVADVMAAEALALFDDTARALAAAFWPGPLTLVVPRHADCPVATLATAGLPTIAIRVPAHPAMQALIAASGRPLAAPSANASGAISPTRAAHVTASLGGKIPLILDGGASEIGLESTIVAVSADGLRLLRPGAVTVEMLVAVCGLPVSKAAGDIIESPGQILSHYAPSKPLRLNALAAREDEYLIGFDSVIGDTSLSMSGNLAEAAAALFDALHIADAAPHSRISIAPIPHRGLGLAINDRLARAAQSKPPAVPPQNSQ